MKCDGPRMRGRHVLLAVCSTILLVGLVWCVAVTLAAAAIVAATGTAAVGALTDFAAQIARMAAVLLIVYLSFLVELLLMLSTGHIIPVAVRLLRMLARS
jgi:hypothetical protein